MTAVFKHGNTTFLIPYQEEDAICELCGKLDELRPYGPNGENICYECGMKDEEAAIAKFTQRLANAAQIPEKVASPLKTYLDKQGLTKR